MGDAQGRETRRNLIVTSTPTTETHIEDSQTAESPLPTDKEDQDISSPLATSSGFVDHNTGPSPEGVDNMYGPTVAVYPQWQQMSHQSPFTAQYNNPHTRFIQSSYQQQSSQNAFNMQNLHRQLPSQHSQHHHPPQSQQTLQQQQQQQYPSGPAPQPIPYPAGQGHSQNQIYGVPGYNAPFYPAGYPPAYNSPLASHPIPNQQPNFPLTAYSSSYPPQSQHTTAAAHGQNYMPWNSQSHLNNHYYYVPQFHQQGQLSPHQMQFASQAQPMGAYDRRSSVPASGIRFGADYESHTEMDHLHFAASRRSSHSPRGLGSSRNKRQFPTSGNSPVKSSSPGENSASVSGNSSNNPTPALHPSLPRGPPRKPKQSGHALWVGNLPPGTNVLALKDYFSTENIESVFLISKSNCAFVNYRTEAACTAAMAKFHDSRFQGVRLVCRLRRNSSPGTPTSASQQPTPMISNNIALESLKDEEKDSHEENTEIKVESDMKEPSSPILTRTGKERFFIVKSLTVEDLDLSVRNGVWATQAHNETVLNTAYESAESVFLIFSANKSGEYYGYARMSSAISEDIASKIEWAPVAHTTDDPDLPKAIFTPATDTAPKGRIIDDSARGTIFWEAIDENASDDESSCEGESSTDRTGISKSWGKPFRIEWISTSKVPFYRTRGLRNPYNVSREVKIARDGTELEPSVGRRLVQMFHRGGSGSPLALSGSGRTTATVVDSSSINPRLEVDSNPPVDGAISPSEPLEPATELAESVKA